MSDGGVLDDNLAHSSRSLGGRDEYAPAQRDGDADGLDDEQFDDDEFDPSQPMNLKFFGQNAQQQADKPHEEEKFNDDQPLPSGGGGGAGGGSGNGGGGRGSRNGSRAAAAAAPVDALAAADTLPAFASASVRALDAQVKAKERVLQKYLDETEENSERVGVMSEHLKNVRAERVHSQALLDAKDADIATEGHLGQLAEREFGRVSTDVSKVEKQIATTQDKVNALQNNHFAATEKLEAFKQQMNWNQEELLQWSLAAKQKDEDREALAQYSKADQAKLKALVLKNENMARLVQQRKAALEAEVTETQAVQIELDKTAEEYRRQHEAKQNTLRQWDESEALMQRRDREIVAIAEKVQQGKAQLRAQEALVAEQQAFLQQEQTNNKQLNVSIGMFERVAEKTRAELQAEKKQLIEFEDEVATQRSELEKAESELKVARATTAALAQQKEEKLAAVAALSTAVAEARHALETEYAQTDNLADRAKQVDALHKEHVTRLAQQSKALQALKESMFKHSHELFSKRKQEADLIAEISGAQGTSRNLQQRIHDLDQRSLKQQEMLYNIEFQVQQLERKVSHASGKRSLEDTMLLNQQITQAQEQLQAMKQQESIIGNQVKRLQEDLRAGKRAAKDGAAKRDALNERIARIELENDSSDRELRETIRKKEELSVQHDMRKLEVKKLREQLSQLADQVLSHENRRAQLTLSMKEREREIELHADVQRAECKAAEEGRHQLAMDLTERKIKVDKLRRKHHTIAAKLQRADEAGLGPDGNGEERTQAYYIIQAAQEREELQRTGDALNAHILQCEREVAALTNTQAMLAGRNALYRAGLQKPDPEGPDAALKASLEEQHRAAIDKLYKHRSYLREITADFEERRNILAQLLNSIGTQQQALGQSEAHVQSVMRDAQGQQEKLDRATRHMLKRQAEYRRKLNLADGEQSVEELSMALAEQRKKNALMLDLLRDFAEQNPNTSHVVSDTLDGLGIRLSRPASAASSRASSSRSHRPDSAASSARPMSSSSQASSVVGNAFGVRGGQNRPPSGRSAAGMLPSIHTQPAARNSRPQSRSNV